MPLEHFTLKKPIPKKSLGQLALNPIFPLSTVLEKPKPRFRVPDPITTYLKNATFTVFMTTMYINKSVLIENTELVSGFSPLCNII